MCGFLSSSFVQSKPPFCDGDHSLRAKGVLEWLRRREGAMKTFAGLIVALAMFAATETASAPSVTQVVIGRTEAASQANWVDRSSKGDRITPLVPARQAVLPPECEPPFSSLAKVPSQSFAARCFT